MQCTNDAAVDFDFLGIFDQKQDGFPVILDHHSFRKNPSFGRSVFFNQFLGIKARVGVSFQAARVMGQSYQESLTYLAGVSTGRPSDVRRVTSCDWVRFRYT